MVVDNDILVDAGTGVADLSIAELAAIDHVFITHTHLDHIASLPLMVDTVGDRRTKPLMVYGTEAVLTILRNHIFNWAIWPDFLQIPSPAHPALQFDAIEVGTVVSLGERRITALPVRHTVPAVAFQLASAHASLVFSGDTGPSPELWTAVNRIDDLRYLLIETSYTEPERRLAAASGHLCPSMLAMELAQLKRPAEVFITHLKPTQPDQIMAEIEVRVGSVQARRLQPQQVFEL